MNHEVFKTGGKNERRLQTILARSPLGMYDPLGNIGRLEGIGGVSNAAAPILEVFLACSDSKQRRTVFESVDQQGIAHLVEAARKIAENPELSRRIVLRTVFGASEQMSVSSLQYLLPSVYLLEGLKNINPSIEPQAQFIFMNEAGIRMNDMDRERVVAERELFVNLAQSYLAVFHPAVLRNVCFLDDTEFTPQAMGTGLYQGLVETLKALLSAEAHEDLLRKAVNHDSSEAMAYQYAALHPLVHDGFFTGAPLRHLAGAVSTDNPELLISIGAQPEKAFYQTRSLLRPSLGLGIDGFSPTPAVQYFAAINVPPYGFFKEGDFSLKQALEEPEKLDAVVKRDFSERTPYHASVQQAVTRLSCDAGGLFSLVNFFREIGG